MQSCHRFACLPSLLSLCSLFPRSCIACLCFPLCVVRHRMRQSLAAPPWTLYDGRGKVRLNVSFHKTLLNRPGSNTKPRLDASSQSATTIRTLKSHTDPLTTGGLCRGWSRCHQYPGCNLRQRRGSCPCCEGAVAARWERSGAAREEVRKCGLILRRRPGWAHSMYCSSL